MKLNTSFLKRCIALAVALVLLVSSSNLGTVLRAFAVEDIRTVTEGALVQNQYEIAGGEGSLLNSNLLKVKKIEFKNLTAEEGEKLVKINLDEKIIEVADYENWKATEVKLLVGSEVVETLEVNNGKVAFAYAGDAFSVEVTYKAYFEVSVETQKKLLNAATWLQAAVQNAADVAELEDNLEVVQEAIGALMVLGYSRQEAQTALKGVDPLLSLEDMITAALRKMMPKF